MQREKDLSLSCVPTVAHSNEKKPKKAIKKDRAPVMKNTEELENVEASESMERTADERRVRRLELADLLKLRAKYSAKAPSEANLAIIQKIDGHFHDLGYKR